MKEITTIIDAVEADMWNYLEELGEMDLEKLYLMNIIQKVLKCRVEVTTTLTSTKANEILQRLKGHLRSLQSQLDDARRKTNQTTCHFITGLMNVNRETFGKNMHIFIH